MILFQGHEVWPHGLGGDVALSILPPIVFYLLKYFNLLPKIGKHMGLWDILLVYLFILFAPNSIYASFEIKHLIFFDHVADHPNLYSFLVFGSISLLGVASTFLTARQIIGYYGHGVWSRLFFTLTISLINGVGVVAGLLDFNSLEGLNPLIIFEIVTKIANSPRYQLILIFTATIFFVLNYLVGGTDGR